MIRHRNLDPGQFPHPNAGVMGVGIHDTDYWVAGGAVLGAASVPGTTFALAATAARAIPTAQTVGVLIAGATSNGDITLRVTGVNQFGEKVFQDILIPSGTAAAAAVLGAATSTSTKVFRKVTRVEVLANANTAATTCEIGVFGNAAASKLGVPVKLAKVTEAVRLVSFVAVGGVMTSLGTTSTVDVSNSAVMPGALAFGGAGTLLMFQLELAPLGMRG